MRKTPTITIKPTDGGFVYGQCAIKAISQAFGFSEKAFYVICTLLKIDPTKGLNYWESTKVINKIGKTLNLKVKYVSNVTGVSYGQMITLLNKHTYIVMFDIHLSFCSKGEITDDYFYDDDPKEIIQALKQIPTGWWEIINQ